jgi:hypothetical protein
LLVDDEAAIREMETRILARLGYEINPLHFTIRPDLG